MRIPPVDWTGTAADGSVWTGVRVGSVAGEYPAWPWQWALDWVAADLEILLKGRVLPLPGCKPYNDERRWQLAKCLTGKHRSLSHHPIDGTNLRRIAAEVLAQLDERGIPLYQAGLGRQAAIFSRDEFTLLVRDLDDRAVSWPMTEAAPPVSCPDRQPTTVVSELYSDESLRTLFEQVHTNALLIYRDLVASWFPALAPTLGLGSFLPILITGQLLGGERPALHGVPQFTFHMTPLPLTEPPRAEVRLVEPGDFPEFDLQRAQEQFLLLRQQIAHIHPGAESWAFTQAASSATSFWHDRPATSLAYRWLWGDLRRLHLVKQLPPTGDDSADFRVSSTPLALPKHVPFIELAAHLAEPSRAHPTGADYSSTRVRAVDEILGTYRRHPRLQRLHDVGMRTLAEMASRLGMPAKTIKIWHHAADHRAPPNDKGQCLYLPPPATKRKLSERRPAHPAAPANDQ